MKKLYVVASISLIALLAIPESSFAGGCPYGGGGGGRRGAALGESPAMKKRRLAVTYELGRKILEGKVVLRASVPGLKTQQEKILLKFKERAPNEKIDEVTGRLSREELDAVNYYLATRYPASSLTAEDIRVARWRKEQALLED